MASEDEKGAIVGGNSGLGMIRIGQYGPLAAVVDFVPPHNRDDSRSGRVAQGSRRVRPLPGVGMIAKGRRAAA
jgi:hypothetical protein